MSDPAAELARLRHEIEDLRALNADLLAACERLVNCGCGGDDNGPLSDLWGAAVRDAEDVCEKARAT